MNTNNHGKHSEQDPDAQLLFLETLVEGYASIDGDIVEIDGHTWAIHGSIPVDGDVIMAEYDTLEEATDVLDELFGAEHGPQTFVGFDQPGSRSTPERRVDNR
jgi:hypothetical protein